MHTLSRRSLLGGAMSVGLPAALAHAAGEPDSPHTLLTVLHTNDFHGRAHLPGQPQGLARLAPLIREIRATMPNVVLLDAGDIIHGTPEEKEFAGRPLLSAMNTLAYDAATVGNHEFDFGQPRLRDAMDYAKFPMLSANVADERTGKPWGGLHPYKIVERGGIRIGVFGLTTPTTVTIQWPRTLSGIQFTDPHEAARRMVGHLRETEHVDMVICLSHLGYQPDRELATAVTGMDLILGGHSHTTLAEQVWVNGALIVQTGCYGKALSRTDLLVQKPAEKGTVGRVAGINGKEGHWWGQGNIPAPLGKTYPTGPLLVASVATPEDPAVVTAYRPYLVPMQKELGEILTTATKALPATEVNQRETALGNLFADAVRNQTKTDIAFAASSQIQPGGLAAGPVRVGSLYEALAAYTRQHLVLVRAPGALLHDTLRKLAADTTNIPVHLSGVVVDANAITIGDRPLDPAYTYTVGAAAHVIQDYLLGKPGVVVLQDDVLAPTVRDAAITYLRGHAPLTNVVTPRWRNRAKV